MLEGTVAMEILLLEVDARNGSDGHSCPLRSGSHTMGMVVSGYRLSVWTAGGGCGGGRGSGRRARGCLTCSVPLLIIITVATGSAPPINSCC